MKKKGFTLVELLAVIAILAILVIIALPNVLKMFNDSKKNAFIVQARKTANVAQEHTIFSGDKTFDCNSLLTGQKYKDCTATVDKNNQVTVDVLGSGTYENFLMVDVTPNANSGTFVDLSKLNTIDIGTEKEFKEPLIKNNKINEPTFKIMSGKEFCDVIFRINTETPPVDDKLNAEIIAYDKMIKDIKIEGDTVVCKSNGGFYLKISFPKGKYTMPMIENNGVLFTENWLQEYEKDKTNDEYKNTDKYYTIEDDVLTITADKDETLYIGVSVGSNGILNNFYLEKILTDELKMNGEENITLTSEEVSSYKDEGVSYKGKTLTGKDVYTYTNLKDKNGEYKYNYIIKTNQGVKILRRYIDVGKTSEKCFQFNKETQEIEQYYFVEGNVSGGKKCPTDVIIPEKISGVQVKSIGAHAFKICSDDIVMSTSFVNNEYEIKPVYRPSCPGIGVTFVVLPEGLENIGFTAFEGNNLKTVTIPSTVTKIDDYAFMDNQLQSVIFKGDKDKIKIGCSAFEGEKHSDSVNAIEDTNCK